MKPILNVLVGIQGSGKSTWAKKYSNTVKNAKIVSSDAIRKENPTWNNNQVFKKVYEDMNNFLLDGYEVVLDATNITYKSRKQIFNNLKVDCVKEAIIFNTKYEDCRLRVVNRNLDNNNHLVPLKVVENYYKSFEIPFLEEGFDIITLVNSVNDKNHIDGTNIVDNIYTTELIAKMYDFEQKNKWHKESLGEHSQMVVCKIFNLIKDTYKRNDIIILLDAARFHDYGKLFTQKPKKNNPEEMCYYNHANVGAYELMCEKNIFKYPVESLFYINYHMQMFDVDKSEKVKNKLINKFGKEKFDALMLFNQADREGCISG